MNAVIDVKHVLPIWEQFRAATDISPSGTRPITRA